MQPFLKDMLILSLTQTGIVFNMIWGLLLPYYSSFVHSNNKDITVKKMYSTYIAFALGQLLASKFLAKYYYITGIRIGFLMISILNLLNTFMVSSFTSLFGVYFVMLLYGVILQSVITGCNLYISERYENGILYAKYLTAVRLVFYLVPLYSSQFTINPYSETATILSKNGEYFFAQHIVKNFLFFMQVFGILSSIVISLGYFCLTNTNQCRNRIAPFLNSLLGKSQFRFNMDKEEIKIIQAISFSHQSIKFTKNFKSFIKQRNSQLLDSLPTQKTIKSELNPEIEEKYNRDGVLVIAIVCFMLLTVYTYCIGMYKYIALVFKLEDLKITFYYSLSTIFNVSGNFLAPSIWQKYPIYYCVIFLFLCDFLNLFIILSSQFNPFLFLFSIWIARTQSGFQPMFADLVCFGLFEPMEAMEKIQLFAYGNFLGNVLGTLMNFLLFSEKHWTLIFYVCLMMVVATLIFFIKNFNVIKKMTKKEFEQLIIKIYKQQCLILQNLMVKNKQLIISIQQTIFTINKQQIKKVYLQMILKWLLKIFIYGSKIILKMFLQIFLFLFLNF